MTLLNTKSYHSMVDYVYSDEGLQNEPESGIVFCHLDNIHRFFKHCNYHKYILVSAESDFGLYYQDANHANLDLHKQLALIDWESIKSNRERYVGVRVGPACKDERCYVKDLYSTKCYSFTNSTFNEIPDNIVKWYCANLYDVDDPRIEVIPFGAADNVTEETFTRLRSKPKTKTLYVNFQPYTIERSQLNAKFAKLDVPGLTFRASPIPKMDYLEEMAEHKYVLCPEGNGLDCYRTYEALYCGCVPVTQESPFIERIQKYAPMLICQDFSRLNDEVLAHYYGEFENIFKTDYLGVLTEEYWRQKLLKDKHELLQI